MSILVQVSSMLRAFPPREASQASAAAISAGRDLRLDLFRGLALWLIFLDHIPSNIVSWITIRNYGFSDATEIFVFISGYTAAFVYGRAMRERGIVVAGARILKRTWQIYVAHIFLFAVYMAEISYISTSFENPLYGEEMGIFDFLRQPDVAIVQAMLLKFKPANMDILPLYITLLATFPPYVWLLLRQPTLALVASAVLYVLSWHFEWNLPAYPSGQWAFNPFAWQLLFGFGAWCGLGGATRIGSLIRSRLVLVLAIAYLLFAFAIVMTWYFPRYDHYVPQWLTDWMYPISKTDLDVLRFAHFLALAALTVRFVPPDWPGLKLYLFRPAILCGQHSLEIFCAGVFLAFAAHFILVEMSDGVLMQVAVSAFGIAAMIATAALISWYKRIEGRGSGPRSPNADLAGGEA
ncbi:MAG: OpgC domain-containing protein [Bradyrhizobiaceae bacterium]|nr:OpgC domain-containing protein [Bradyrhizobiaceae bacterium]